MKRFTIPFSLLVLGLVIGITPIASSQTSENLSHPGQDLTKIQILIAINRAELSLEQLQALQAIVQATIDMRDTIVTALEDFQEFLTNWTGSADEFEAALEQKQQELRDLMDALHALWKSNAETIKDMLTASQFEVLRPVLKPVIGPPVPQRASQDPPERPEQGRPGRRVPDFSRELRLLKGLDLLNEVLTEKIEILQSQ